MFTVVRHSTCECLRERHQIARIMRRLWWLNLIRGIVALMVGMLILGWPTIRNTLFVNVLAICWLVSRERCYSVALWRTDNGERE